ncbi:MAG: hypothetical protein AB1352_00275 [Patescibacteria group bacterium]
MQVNVHKRRLLEFGGLAFIFCIIGVVFARGIWATRAEARDRKRLDDIKNIRVALQEYFKLEGSFPGGDTVALGQGGGDQLCAGEAQKGFLGTGENCGEGATVFLDPIPSDIDPVRNYLYHALPEGCTDACNDYELTFSLEYGAGDYGKGAYRANRTMIMFLSH